MKTLLASLFALLVLSSTASAQCYATTFDGYDLDGSTIHIDHNLGADAVIFAVYSEGGLFMIPGGGSSIVMGVRQISDNRLDLYVDSSELTYYPNAAYSVRVCE